MLFRVKGIWRGLTWGCALAGRPSVQLALMDNYDQEHASSQGITLHFDDLIDVIAGAAPIFSSRNVVFSGGIEYEYYLPGGGTRSVYCVYHWYI